MKRPSWKWLVEAPLTPAWRRRLEVTLGVVMSGAAVVVLSTAIRPDPAKLATKLPVIQSSPPTPEELEMARLSRLPAWFQVPLSSEFREAVTAGDAAAMQRHYRTGMPLQGLLAVAARSGKQPAVDFLLHHGADIHDGERSWLAPILAADAHPELVKYLRSRGAAEPTIEEAAHALAPNAVERLLATHPDLNDPAINPLQAAASGGPGDPGVKLWIVQRLLAAGADPSRHDIGGTALEGAIDACTADIGTRHAAIAIVRLLLDRDAPVTGGVLASALNLTDESTRETILDLLLERRFDKADVSQGLAQAWSANPADVKRLVQKAGVDWAWHDGENDAALPVLAAIGRGDRDQVRALLDAGAPVDARYKDGSSNLGAALDALANSPEEARIVELLVTRGADVNRRLPDGRTPLFAAAEAGNLRTVNFLLERGARVNERILDETALDAADRSDSIAVARVLHAHGGQRAPKPPGFTPPPSPVRDYGDGAL